MKQLLKIRIRHIFAVLLILIVSINFSGEADDTDDDLDCSACDNSADDNDSSDSCSSEASQDYDDDSSTFDCAACYSEHSTTTGTSGSTSSSDNRSPIVTIPSPTISVAPGSLVSLLAIARDPDGDLLKYKWMQISGLPKVVLTNKASTNATFLAPPIRTVLQFQFLADDGDEEERGLIVVNVGP